MTTKAHVAEATNNKRETPVDPLAHSPLAGKLLVSAQEAGEILSLGRSMVYVLMDAGELQTVSFGRRRMIVAESLTALVDRKIAEAA